MLCASTLQNRRKSVKAGVVDAYLLLNLNPNLTISLFVITMIFTVLQLICKNTK